MIETLDVFDRRALDRYMKEIEAKSRKRVLEVREIIIQCLKETYGDYPQGLAMQVDKTAMDITLLVNFMGEISRNPKVIMQLNGTGGRKAVVHPLISEYRVMTSNVNSDLKALGLNVNAATFERILEQKAGKKDDLMTFMETYNG